jgi:hypothetical protein
LISNDSSEYGCRLKHAAPSQGHDTALGMLTSACELSASCCRSNLRLRCPIMLTPCSQPPSVAHVSKSGTHSVADTLVAEGPVLLCCRRIWRRRMLLPSRLNVETPSSLAVKSNMHQRFSIDQLWLLICPSIKADPIHLIR